MKDRLCLLVALLFLFACNSSKKGLPSNTNSMPTAKAFAFPMDWIGQYEGELTIINSPVDSTTVNMGLSIGSPDATGLYPWILSYGDQDKRYYGLEAINVEKGFYRIDELNSIKLDGYLRGNHFITRFDVMGSDLLVDYEKKEAGIQVRFYISSSESSSASGGVILGQDTVPTVNSYPVMVTQSAWLKEIIE